MRGIGGTIKMMLSYLNTNYKDIIYDDMTWFEEKNNYGLDFPNLPYVIDGTVNITQTWAI